MRQALPVGEGPGPIGGKSDHGLEMGRDERMIGFEEALRLAHQVDRMIEGGTGQAAPSNTCGAATTSSWPPWCGRKHPAGRRSP